MLDTRENQLFESLVRQFHIAIKEGICFLRLRKGVRASLGGVANMASGDCNSRLAKIACTWLDGLISKPVRLINPFGTMQNFTMFASEFSSI
mmetsp:Transcript_4406/g.7542  ORF Transcript_4406/g.7542 Transcript_4406/m.7542 type:complete len:92 (-) Transcript_4406:59-334(-)